jgi:hypothetical protein
LSIFKLFLYQSSFGWIPYSVIISQTPLCSDGA